MRTEHAACAIGFEERQMGPVNYSCYHVIVTANIAIMNFSGVDRRVQVNFSPQACLAQHPFINLFVHSKITYGHRSIRTSLINH